MKLNMKLNKIFLFLLFSFFSITITLSQTKVNGIAQRGGKVVQTSSTTTYNLMETYPSCTITIYLAGTSTLSTIYSDTSGTLKSNPFTSNSSDASYSFYINAGTYDIKFSGTGITSPFTISSISVTSSVGSLFSVEAYGAVCDGIVDDRVAFQAAAAALNSAGGGIYSIPNKTCKVGGTGATTEVVLLTKSALLQGSGGSSRIMWASSIPNTVNGFVIRPATVNDSRGIQVKDLAMYGESGNPVKYGLVLDCTNAPIATFEISNFQVLTKLGIGGLWLNNSVHRADGIFSGNIYNTLIVGAANFDYIGDSVNLDNFTITGDGFFDWTQLPAPAAGGSDIAHSSFTNNGIRIHSGLKLHFTHNQVEYQTSANIGSNGRMLDLIGELGQISDMTITGNIFRGRGTAPDLHAIGFGNESRALVDDNVFDLAASKSGIDVTNSAGFFFVGLKNSFTGLSTSMLSNPFSKPYITICPDYSIEWAGFQGECTSYKWITNGKFTNLYVVSTTPVANLNASPVTYNIAGVQIISPRNILDVVTLNGAGTISVTFAIPYTSNTSYNCWANYITTSGAPQIVRNSGSSLTLNGVIGASAMLGCSGN